MAEFSAVEIRHLPSVRRHYVVLDLICVKDVNSDLCGPLAESFCCPIVGLELVFSGGWEVELCAILRRCRNMCGWELVNFATLLGL